MAPQSVRDRLEAREAYEAAIRQLFSSKTTPVDVYAHAFGNGPFATLYKRRRVLLRPSFWPLLYRLLRHRKQWVRDPSTWSAQGHSARAVVGSLAFHLYCRYPVARFWQAEWTREDALPSERSWLFCRIARGESIHALSCAGALGAPLTRRAAHLFAGMHHAPSFVGAIRMAQCGANGGPRWLGKALLAAPWDELAAPSAENRRDVAIGWMSRQTDLTPRDVELVGRIADGCHDFRWSGRTVASIRRIAEDLRWLRAPAVRRTQEVEATPPLPRWEPCGLAPLIPADRKAKHVSWTVQELCTYGQLVAEGRALDHCVATYAAPASRGECSIWSVRVGGVPVLTIEVRGGFVVQVRGASNRAPTPQERTIVTQWRRLNGLD